MTLWDLLVLLLVAGICGGVAQALAGFTRGGCLVSVVVGFIGALLGMWLANALELPAVLVIVIGGRPFPIVWSVIGGVLLVTVLGMLTPRRR
jgi:uncharacterized membrane protein YeaQ/YmgE (transglycosylase-associated protein family)